jgi:DNA-binding beta-propeller fold protein YncE
MATKKKKASRTGRARRRARPGGRGRRVLLFLLLLFVLGGLAGSVWLLKGDKPEIPIPSGVALSVGTRGSGNGALDSPRGIAIGPEGDVFVADLSNGRIVVFGKDGAFKRNLGRAGAEAGKAKAGEFNEPSGVAVAPDGSLWVADAWNGRVQHLSGDGKPLGEYGGSKYSFYSPRNVAVDRAGNVYVADTGNSMVKIIDGGGRIIRQLGGRGSGNGQFNEVFGLALNAAGEIFAADPGNRKIHKFSPLPAAEFVKAVKVPGWQVNPPFWPHLACDAQGFVYAVDSGGRRIWVYDSDLKYRGTLGGPAGELFATPLGLAFAPDGALWVSDVAANRLIKLAPFSVPALQ